MASLQAYLTSRAMASNIPHGIKYEYPNELVVNCFATGSVTIQGQHIKGALANELRAFVELINKKHEG